MVRIVRIVALLVALAVPGAVLAGIVFAGGDGTSQDQAIVIEGAVGESDGVASEYDWLRRHRPGAKMLRQALAMNGDRVFDILTIETDGRRETLYFEISGFFGK